MSKKEEKHNFTLIRSRFEWEKDPPDETESFSIFREEVIFVRTVRGLLLLLRRNSKGKTKSNTRKKKNVKFNWVPRNCTWIVRAAAL